VPPILHAGGGVVKPGGILQNAGMFLIDFQQSPRRAFLHGFLKGLAAPVMLFHAEAPLALPSITPLPVRRVSDAEALAGDWRRVGADLGAVIARHGQGTPQDAR
jgi:hypothetical protein